MANIKHSYAVYNSVGQFFARFTSYARALRWAQRGGMEWSAIIRKERETKQNEKHERKTLHCGSSGAARRV